MHGRSLPLDGLRGVAVAAVVLYHLGYASSGFLGVDVFFVLSGYLITGLLVQELAVTGTVRLARFTKRRLLRLYPALLVVVLFVLAVAGATRELPKQAPDAAAALLYIATFVDLHGLLDHTWTLALEEQFYLAWPLLLLATRRVHRVGYAIPITLLVVLLALDRAGAEGTHAYVRAMGLPVGCALALAPAFAERLRPLGPAALVTLLVGLFVSLPDWLTTGWPMSGAVPVAACCVAWLACRDHVPGLTTVAMLWLGTRSYSLYLWHFPLISLTLHHAPSAIPELSRHLIALVASLIAAELSFRFVERPVLRWRDARQAPSHRASTAG